MNNLNKYLQLLKGHWGSLFEQEVTNLMAYGSAVLPQTNDRSEVARNTVDLLVEVRDSSVFHSHLLKTRPSDYGGLGQFFGTPLVNFCSQSIFPMHSNHILLEGKKIKYSVIGQVG